MREAFLLAGERAARRADHSLIAGTAPPRATLRLRKRFVTETSRPGVVVRDFLSTRLSVPPSGRYTWHVNPSGRPLFPRERWSMSCRRPGGGPSRTTVAVGRGERRVVRFGPGCRRR